jgi:regulatory protein
MVRVIEIKQSKRHNERYMVFTDDGESYKLADDTMFRLNIKTGMDVDATTLATHHHADETKWASAAAFNYLKYRQRSQKEITVYLQRKDYEPDTIASVLDKLNDYGYVDDQAFAKEWVRAKTAVKGQGSQRLKRDLKQKGIHDDAIDEALEQYHEADEKQNAIVIAQKVWRQNKAKDAMTIKRKIANKLVYQGFEWSVINQAIREVLNGEDEDDLPNELIDDSDQ